MLQIEDVKNTTNNKSWKYCDDFPVSFASTDGRLHVTPFGFWTIRRIHFQTFGKLNYTYLEQNKRKILIIIKNSYS